MLGALDRAVNGGAPLRVVALGGPGRDNAPMRTLASVANPLVKELLRLHDARGRREAGAFLVEGRRAIDGFLAAGMRPDLGLLREGEPLPQGWPPPLSMSSAVARRLSQAMTPSGFLARFPLPAPRAVDPAAGGLVLVGIADPGNLGTLLRSAAAFACPQVALCGGADPWQHKVVQASVGALAKVQPIELPADAGPAVLAGGAPLCGLVAEGGVAPEQLPPGPRWLLVGSEAHGLPAAWVAACAERLTLPMAPGVESLNAAVAGSIALYVAGAPRRGG